MYRDYYGYYICYSYKGRMPDGEWRIFVTEKEYHEAFDDALTNDGG